MARRFPSDRCMVRCPHSKARAHRLRSTARHASSEVLTALPRPPFAGTARALHAGEARKHRQAMNRYFSRFLRRSTPFAIIAPLTATSVFLGCTGEDERSACSWLFAPPSFVDAGQPGCTAEPSGQRCDPSTGRCQDVCAPGEYLLTCAREQATRLAIPEQSLQDPVISSERPIRCSPLVTNGAGSSGANAYCCQCER